VEPGYLTWQIPFLFQLANRDAARREDPVNPDSIPTPAAGMIMPAQHAAKKADMPEGCSAFAES
jgi:hypothetical protein